MKALLFLFTLSSLVFSNTYEFDEIRYYDAFEDSSSRSGVIHFSPNSVLIKYEHANQEILYDSNTLTLRDNKTIVELGEMQQQTITSFLNVLLLVYENDMIKIEYKFDISNNNTNIILVPKYNEKRYIEKILLKKLDKSLKEVKLILTNFDTITIRIGNEVR